MRIDPVLGMPSEVERPATTGAVAAAATEINVHSNDVNAPVTAVPEVQKEVQSAPNSYSETVWLKEENRPVFRIVDEKNGQVVCQIPSAELLRISRNLDDLMSGNEGPKLDITS